MVKSVIWREKNIEFFDCEKFLVGGESKLIFWGPIKKKFLLVSGKTQDSSREEPVGEISGIFALRQPVVPTFLLGGVDRGRHRLDQGSKFRKIKYRKTFRNYQKSGMRKLL